MRDTLEATPYAEVQRHKLQAASASFTSLMVNGVRAGAAPCLVNEVRTDPTIRVNPGL